MLRIFGWSVGITIAVLVGALIIGGAEVATLVGILAVLEISLSFDNAVVNATILRRMRPVLAEDVPDSRHRHRRLRDAVPVPHPHRVGDRAHQPMGSVPARAAPPERVRGEAHRRPPVDRRLRRHLPLDDLPGLHARPRAGDPLAVLAGAAACPAGQAPGPVGRDRPAVPPRRRGGVLGRVHAAGAHRWRRRSGDLPRRARGRRVLRGARGRGRGGRGRGRRGGRGRGARARGCRAGAWRGRAAETAAGPRAAPARWRLLPARPASSSSSTWN